MLFSLIYCMCIHKYTITVQGRRMHRRAMKLKPWPSLPVIHVWLAADSDKQQQRHPGKFNTCLSQEIPRECDWKLWDKKYVTNSVAFTKITLQKLFHLRTTEYLYGTKYMKSKWQEHTDIGTSAPLSAHMSTQVVKMLGPQLQHIANRINVKLYYKYLHVDL